MKGWRRSIRHEGSSSFELAQSRLDDPPPVLQGHYNRFNATARWSAPVRSVGISASRYFRLCVFPWHPRTSSQFRYESLNMIHASCTPDATWSVNRFLSCLSQRTFKTQVLTSSVPFSMRIQRFTCVRLPHSHMTQSSCAF